MGSARAFGLVMAAAALIISLWPLAAGGSVRWWLAAIAFCFAGLAIFAPRLLAPLNKIWFRFGLMLGAVVAPVAHPGPGRAGEPVEDHGAAGPAGRGGLTQAHARRAASRPTAGHRS